VSEGFPPTGDALSLSAERRLDGVCLRFEAAWQAGQRPLIEPYLNDVPPGERPALLRELVALDLVYRRRVGETPTPDDYRRRFPEQETLVQDAFDRAAGLLPNGADGETGSPPPPPAGGLRYTAVRLHAHGGLGEVHVAEDAELHRSVALKRMRRHLAHDPDNRRRFLREAEITGRLEHPGIVPVYGLVRDESGEPAYAMRFVEGETLKEAADRYHAAPDRMAFRQLLNHFVAACNAVAYAHSRGVIHRDLKPSNVLVGRFAETLVVDWGLAKVVGRIEPAQTDGEGTLTTAEEPDGEATALGQAIGTPPFMSPEQAAGRWNVVGPASDVYSLGATLYYLLTGQAPYQGQDKFEVLVQVQRGSFIPPRQVKADVPWALDAVCRKAMALEPADRYATATAMATEIEHWLADEPVRAYREPATARLGRWARRHKPWVTGAAMLGLTALVALAGLAWQQEHARRRLDQARQQALAYEKQARESVQKYFVQTTEDPRWKAVGLEPVRKDLLAQARDYFLEFVRQRGDDPNLRAELADAHFRLGYITAEIGDKEAAIAEYQQALALWQELFDTQPSVNQYRYHLARTYNNLAILYHATGRLRPAEEAYHQVLNLWQQQADAQPTVTEYRGNVASSYNNLGVLYRATGRPEEAERAYQQALALRQKLADAHPSVSEYQSHLAHSHNNLGLLYRATGRPEVAEKAYQRALALYQKLAGADPSVIEYQSSLAACHYNLANLCSATGRPLEAERAYQQAQALHQKLADAHPTVSKYQSDLAASHGNLGLLYSRTGRPLEAEKAYQRALALLEKLADAHPTVPEYAVNLGGNLCNLGHLKLDQARPEAALPCYQRAITTLEAVLARVPRDPTARQFLCNSHGGRAEALARLQRHGEAVQDWDRAIALDDGSGRNGLRLRRALMQVQQGDHTRATTEVEEVLQDGNPSAGLLYGAACVYALAAGKVQDAPLVERYAVRAVALLRAAVVKGYRNVAHLKQDTDLDALRQRPDFQAVLADLEKQP
jgi:serine/threonine-protein kinase